MATETKIQVGTSWTHTNGRTWTVTEVKPFGICSVQSGMRFGEMYQRDIRAILATKDVATDPLDDFDDAAADRWNDAALAALRGRPCPAQDADSLKGYADGLEARKVRVVMPARPEGYYHAPIGTFA